MPLPVQNQQKSNNPHLPDNNKKLERNTPDEHRSTPLLGKTQRNFEKKSIILPDQTHQKLNNPPLSIKAKNCEGEDHTTSCKMYTTFIHKIFYY